MQGLTIMIGKTNILVSMSARVMIMHYISRSFMSVLVMPLLGRVYVFYVRI
jgi:hypothetical protein